MASTARTFIALPIPEVQRTRLGRLQSLIAPDLPGARWSEPRQFHITLGFLGDVLDIDLARLCRAVTDASAPFPPFTLNLQGLGAFPTPEQPRAVWVGVTGPGLDTLNELQGAIADAVTEAGYPPDDRFHPHVTLGRLKGGKKHGEPPDLNPRVNHYRQWSAGNFEVAAVVAYASTLTPEGPDYMSLATAPLKPRKPGQGPPIR